MLKPKDEIDHTIRMALSRFAGSDINGITVNQITKTIIKHLFCSSMKYKIKAYLDELN